MTSCVSKEIAAEPQYMTFAGRWMWRGLVKLIFSSGMVRAKANGNAGIRKDEHWLTGLGSLVSWWLNIGTQK